MKTFSDLNMTALETAFPPVNVHVLLKLFLSCGYGNALMDGYYDGTGFMSGVPGTRQVDKDGKNLYLNRGRVAGWTQIANVEWNGKPHARPEGWDTNWDFH